GLLNLNALAATGRASEFGAENAGDVLLQVGEIGDELETEEVVAVFGGSAGDDDTRRWDGDGLARDVDRVCDCWKTEGEALAGWVKEDAHFPAEDELLVLETEQGFLETGGRTGNLFGV